MWHHHSVHGIMITLQAGTVIYSMTLSQCSTQCTDSALHQQICANWSPFARLLVSPLTMVSYVQSRVLAGLLPGRLDRTTPALLPEQPPHPPQHTILLWVIRMILGRDLQQRRESLRVAIHSGSDPVCDL